LPTRNVVVYSVPSVNTLQFDLIISPLFNPFYKLSTEHKPGSLRLGSKQWRRSLPSSSV
ncbi:unnamed protein product, partial [Allacma fusca]